MVEDIVKRGFSGEHKSAEDNTGMGEDENITLATRDAIGQEILNPVSLSGHGFTPAGGGGEPIVIPSLQFRIHYLIESLHFPSAEIHLKESVVGNGMRVSAG